MTGELVRREVCAWCGGVLIAAATSSDEVVAATVRRHRLTARHLEAVFGYRWMAYREIPR